MPSKLHMRKRWTTDELSTCVRVYRAAATKLSAIDKSNMSERDYAHARREILRLNKEYAVSLFEAGRPITSYEPRMQNISFLLSCLDEPIIAEYPPLRNVGPRLTPELLALINDEWEREERNEEPTTDAESLQIRIQSALSKRTAEAGPPPPRNPTDGTKAEVIVHRWSRDAEIIAWTLRQANGKCEACEEDGPFDRVDGTRYLEVHHLRPLAEGGPDDVSNTIAVCPTCHRRFHYSKGRDQYRKSTIHKIPRLKDYPSTVKRQDAVAVDDPLAALQN